MINKASAKALLAQRPSVAMFAYCCLIVYWCAGVVCDFAYKLIHPPLLCTANNGNIGIADFVQMYVGGKLALLGSGGGLYDVNAQLQLLNGLASPIHVDRMLPLTYLPSFYVGMIPLASLTLQNAYLLWCCFSLIIFFASLIVLARTSSGFNWWQIALFCAGCMVCSPFQIGLQLGQTSFIVAAGLALFFLSFLRSRDYLAGACLLILMIKPQYGLFLVIPALVLGRWKILVSFFLLLLAQCCLVTKLLGSHVFADYVQYMSQVAYSAKAFGMTSISHSNLRELIALFLPGDLALKCAPALLFIGLFVCAAIWHRLKVQPIGVHRFALAYTTVLSLLFAPHSNFHDALILAPAALLTLRGLSIPAAMAEPEIPTRTWMIVLLTVPLMSFISMLVQSCGINANAPAVLTTNLLLLFSGASVLWRASCSPPQPVVLAR